MDEEAQTTQLIHIDHIEDQKQQSAANTQMRTSALHVSMLEASVLYEPSNYSLTPLVTFILNEAL